MNDIEKEKLVKEFTTYLKNRKLDQDVIIYYNNKRLFVNSNKIESNIKVSDYLDYYNEDTITVTFEGPLYYAINGYDNASGYGDAICANLDNLFAKYGMYFELGDYWNFTLNKISDDV